MLKKSNIFKDVKKVHLIGIKGRGMVSLANLLCDLGLEITGSDTSETYLTDKLLSKLPVRVFEGFNQENITADTDLIVSSVVYYDYLNHLPLLNNPEVNQALKNQLNLYAYPQFLGKLFQESYGIAISGTHGKTSTTALTGLIFEKGGLDPTTICGGEVVKWEAPSRVGKSEFFILEADEYRESFLNYKPEVLVVGSLSYDHPDYFNSFNDYLSAYIKLIEQVKPGGIIFVLGDNPNSLKTVESFDKNKIITYGVSTGMDLTIPERDIFNGFQQFTVQYYGKYVGKFSFPLPGIGYLQNALVSIGIALEKGVHLKAIQSSLKEYLGTRRRFEIKKRTPYVVIDDYAGLPREIETTLKGTREFYPKNTIWAVFQPHTYSRTEALLKDLAESLNYADKVVVLDIYAPPREKEGKVHSLDLIKMLGKKGIYQKTNSEAIDYLQNEVKDNDVIITMGIGEVWPVADALSL
ncbi:MAG: UDP-N-acetylmuramate--L-alanine ligase [candidate division WS2 bacterium]|uniref:UDP-N-acetylmuramate--L-alanine ligase n=1 Tax=Psychracetigena formicireducens TaxID=2986056 RepID=A0A9E2BIN5_PSYF1|nr:UDP-N-acetylmuramate--L-alanine ligase [Candidatus Psychracetigena formicireducens]